VGFQDRRHGISGIACRRRIGIAAREDDYGRAEDSFLHLFKKTAKRRVEMVDMGSFQMSGMVVCAGLCLVLHAGEVSAKQGNIGKIEMQDSSRSAVAAKGCGDEMELDRASGRVVRRNRVDLIVTEVDLSRTNSGGVAIKTTIKNRCPGTVDRNVHVAIDDVVVTVGPPAPNGTVQSGAVVLASKTSYTVMVDYDNRISEVNETNNRCRATFPASFSTKKQRCP
jgi:hypothetical protein